MRKNISHFRYVGRIDLFLTEKIKTLLKNPLEGLLVKGPGLAAAERLRSLTSPRSVLFQTAEGTALPCMHRRHRGH